MTGNSSVNQLNLLPFFFVTLYSQSICLMRSAFIVFLLIFSAMTACRKNADITGKIYQMDQIQVPDAFTWETTRKVFLDLGVTYSGTASPFYARIDIYDADPTSGGDLIASGGLRQGNPYQAVVTLPVILNKVYLLFRPVQGNIQMAFLNVEDTITMIFTNSAVTVAPDDSDSDQVPDFLDDYPGNSALSFISYYPNIKDEGTFLVEDIWPYKGDYDLNDLVVRFRYMLITNRYNSVDRILGRFYIQAVGAGLRDGFGLQFDDITPDQVSGVSGMSLQQGYIVTDPNGLESNQEKAVVIIFDKTDNILHNPMQGSPFFNTWPGIQPGTSDTLMIDIRFSQPISLSVMIPPPFNLFLIQNMQRSIEIHLPNHPPTTMANTSLFSTGDDGSLPLTGRYYLSKINIPWVLQIPEAFMHTYEQVELSEGYLKFDKWATSGGKDFPDWYQDKYGYRNPLKIYH